MAILTGKRTVLGVSPIRYNQLVIENRKLKEENERLIGVLMEVKTYLMRAKKMQKVIDFIDGALD